MAEGFQLDLRHGNQKAVTEWIEGAPERAWYGLKVRGKTRLPVETFRGNRCGYLEHSAPQA
jgi:hypothetical protein